MRLLLVLLMFAPLAACATPQGVEFHRRPPHTSFGPWSTSDDAPTVASARHGGATSASATAPSGPNDGFVDFVYQGYARYLTKVDGPRCEHRPTCSHYALLAVKRHGYVVGSMLTIDRLLRGSRSSALRSLDIYKVEDGVRYYYDPVENNDFFF